MKIDIAQYAQALLKEIPQSRSLAPVRERLARGGEVIMTADLMLQILESMYYVSVTVSPNPFNDLEPWDCCKIEMRYNRDWLQYAQPDWMDALNQILQEPPAALISPPSPSEPEHPFKMVYHEVARRFPDKALEDLKTLLENKNLHAQLSTVLFYDYDDGMLLS